MTIRMVYMNGAIEFFIGVVRREPAQFFEVNIVWL